MTGRDLLAVLAVVFIWGINFVITKFALRDFTPFLQIGLLLAALGLVCFAVNYVRPGASGSGASTPLGFVLILGAAAMWAASNIIVRRMQQHYADYSALALVVWSSAAAIVPFAALSYFFDDEAIRWHWLDAHWTS